MATSWMITYPGGQTNLLDSLRRDQVTAFEKGGCKVEKVKKCLHCNQRASWRRGTCQKCYEAAIEDYIKELDQRQVDLRERMKRT